ncbi:hypothetical protein ACHAPU_006157 [Fusarium lateritium]
MQHRKRQLEEDTVPSTTSPKRICVEVETSCSREQSHDECLNSEGLVLAAPLTEEALRLHEEALRVPEDEQVAPPTLVIAEWGGQWRHPGPDQDFEPYYDQTMIVVRMSTEECFRVTFPARVDINTLRDIDTSALDLTSVAALDIPFEFASFVADIYGVELESMVVTYIPGGHMWPRFRSSLTAAPEGILQYCHVKQGAVGGYNIKGKGRDIKDLVLSEATVCELLMKHPHPNIAKYWGCDVVDGRIRGLCFGKYAMTLHERAVTGVPLDIERCLQGVRDGLEHLHSLGLAHNDINPQNVMLDAGDNPIIIDFDACTNEGEKLTKGGTPGWWIEGTKVGSRENDLFALVKLEEWFALPEEDGQKNEEAEDEQNDEGAEDI